MSDLNSYVQKAINKNLKKFGTIRKDCEYIFSIDPGYNSTTGTLVPKLSSDYFDDDFVSLYSQYFVGNDFVYPVKVIFADFNLTINQASTGLIGTEPIKDGDKKGLISALDLPIPPIVGNVINSISDGIKYQIKGMKTDPTKSIYLFHLRVVYDPVMAPVI